MRKFAKNGENLLLHVSLCL